MATETLTFGGLPLVSPCRVVCLENFYFLMFRYTYPLSHTIGRKWLGMGEGDREEVTLRWTNSPSRESDNLCSELFHGTKIGYGYTSKYTPITDVITIKDRLLCQDNC